MGWYICCGRLERLGPLCSSYLFHDGEPELKSGSIHTYVTFQVLDVTKGTYRDSRITGFDSPEPPSRRSQRRSASPPIWCAVSPHLPSVSLPVPALSGIRGCAPSRGVLPCERGSPETGHHLSMT